MITQHFCFSFSFLCLFRGLRRAFLLSVSRKKKEPFLSQHLFPSRGVIQHVLSTYCILGPVLTIELQRCLGFHLFPEVFVDLSESIRNDIHVEPLTMSGYQHFRKPELYNPYNNLRIQTLRLRGLKLLAQMRLEPSASKKRSPWPSHPGQTGTQQQFYCETSIKRLIIVVYSWPQPPVNSGM